MTVSVKISILQNLALLFMIVSCGHAQELSPPKIVEPQTMNSVYEEIKTPYKYGVVMKHPDTSKMIDSPTIFRKHNTWYMTYIIFDGKGYETWIAESKNLLEWTDNRKILSFTEGTWDGNQKAGYMSLVNTKWGGDYSPASHDGKYWMTYLGGKSSGYEAGTLKTGLAYSKFSSTIDDWQTETHPILSPEDDDARWYDNKTIYKSLVIEDKENHTGYPFVMYYNAKGDTAHYESIAMAVSKDMKEWKRYGDKPVISKGAGICGDAQIARYRDLYIMFYFGAFWKPGAFERFACSYDLIHWTDWEGQDLVSSTEDYDRQYAHKPWVIKWNDTVYHFYNAVGSEGRVIALATSKPLKKNGM